MGHGTFTGPKERERDRAHRPTVRRMLMQVDIDPSHPLLRSLHLHKRAVYTLDEAGREPFPPLSEVIVSYNSVCELSY